MDAAVLFSEKTAGFFRNIVFSGFFGSGGLRNAIKLAGTFRFQKRQSRKRAKAAMEGKTVPPILIASITRDCNLDCEGCYSRTLRPAAGFPELSDDRFMEVFREALDMGTGTIMLAGGEPLLRRGLLERASGLPGVLIPVFTNGTLIDEDWADITASGRLVPVFSIEGDTADTDGRRGPGVHAAALSGMAMLRERGALFGASITLTKGNADAVLSEAYLSRLEALGIRVLFLIEYVPVAPGTEGLVLEDAQKERLTLLSASKRSFGIVTLPGDEESFGACLAAGPGFIHLSADGSLEACPFAPFSDTGVAEMSLSEALDSPLMRAIRERHSELTETKGGCALWNKRGWISSLSGCGIKPPAGTGASANLGNDDSSAA